MKRGVNQKGRKSPYHSHYETKKLLLIYILTIKFERGEKKGKSSKSIEKKVCEKTKKEIRKEYQTELGTS